MHYFEPVVAKLSFTLCFYITDLDVESSSFKMHIYTALEYVPLVRVLAVKKSFETYLYFNPMKSKKEKKKKVLLVVVFF